MGNHEDNNIDGNVRKTKDNFNVKYLQNRNAQRWLKNLDKSLQRRGKDKLVILLSFDIVSSVRLKYKSSNWRKVVKKFHDTSFGYSNPVLLKPMGDERVYLISFDDLFNVCNAMEYACKHCISLNEKLSVIGCGEVFVKAAIWIAPIGRSKDADNIVMKVNSFGRDLAGRDIDEHFRAAKESKKNIIVVDPKIMFAIALTNEIFANKVLKTGKFKVPESFVKSLDDFITKLNSTELEGEVKRKLTEDKVKLNIFSKKISFYGYHYFKNVPFKGKDEKKNYPLFIYYDMELVNEVSDIHTQYSKLNKSKKKAYSDAELVELLSEIFHQAEWGRDKRMQHVLELMSFDV